MQVVVQCTQKQREFLIKCLEDDEIDTIAYGGARGGGKTFVSCIAMVLLLLKNPRTKGLMIRKTQGAADQNLKDEIENVIALLGIPYGAIRYKIAEKAFFFPNGSYLKLGYCKLDNDYELYMGTEYTYVVFEEATQHKEESWLRVSGSCRSRTGTKAKKWLTCNPGGIGHGWVKDRYISYPGYASHFIRATIRSNYAQLERDPGYARRELSHLPDWLRRQWYDGDWDAVAGAFFVLPASAIYERPIPYWAEWVGGVDWGRSAPFCTLFLATWTDALNKTHVHVVSEIYKAGLELDEQAYFVHERESEMLTAGVLNAENIRYYADPSVAKRIEGVSTEAGRTIRSVWANHDFYVLPAHSNARVPGWEMIRNLIAKGILTLDPSCRALIKEIESAIYEGTASGGNPTGEDIDADCSDHALDSLRYCLVSISGLDAALQEQDPYALPEGVRAA